MDFSRNFKDFILNRRNKKGLDLQDVIYVLAYAVMTLAVGTAVSLALAKTICKTFLKRKRYCMTLLGQRRIATKIEKDHFLSIGHN